MLEKRIKNIAQEAAEKHGFFLIDFTLRGHSNNRVIEVFIDGEKDVSADDCAGVSRYINNKISEGALLEAYRLDVSSPGIDRPLKFLKQFPKNINRNFEVTYNSNNQTKKLKGKLTKIEGNDLYFLSNNTETLVNFDDIKKAKVTVSF